ncbi:MAG: hypothetical protein JWP09_56 [Candidatus Taylorbacteria bacterium]|nr:hypothetical protein [Candidatus Taylorbacteria bacterium]
MNLFKKAHLKLGIITLGVLIAGLVGAYSVNATDSTKRIIGYSWSSNVGWISFNDGTVSVDASNNLVGYAWSSNIGWIKFGGLSGFPDSSMGANAKMTDNGLSGWARAVSVMNPLTYKSIDNRGGWDGWISLSSGGRTPSYGVTSDGTKFSGFAWGSDVVGWMDWSSVKITTNDVLCASANGLIVDGESTTIYTKITKGADKGKCQTQDFTCKGQTLTPVGEPSAAVSCNQDQSTDCEDRDGIDLKNGESYKFFKERVVAAKSCDGANITCKDGVLVGPDGVADDTHVYSQCLSAPNYKESQ